MSAAVETVAAEVAEQQFQRWAEAMDLVSKFDESDMDEDDQKEFTKAKAKVLEAMRFGRLVVTDAGELLFTPQVGNTASLTFPEPDGAAIMAIDKAKQQEGIKRSFLLMAAITGQPPERFAKMKQRDLTVCSSIAGLLVGR